jgi:hypothetical protein
VLLQIGQIIARHGAQIAFPTQTLQVQAVVEGPHLQAAQPAADTTSP